MGAAESQRDQQSRGSNCDDEAGNSSTHCEQHAFHQCLHNHLSSGRADGKTNCGLAAPCHRSCQQQIGDIGACNQEHKATNGKENLQTATVLFFHHGNACPGRHDVDELFGKSVNYVRHPVGRITGIGLHPLPQDRSQPRSHSGNRSTGAQAADHTKPRGNGLMQQRTVPIDHRLLLHGNPEVWRIAAQGLAKKSRRSNSNYGEGMALYHEHRAHNGSVGAISCFPSVVAEHDNGSCGGLIVVSGENSSTKCAYAEGGKITSSNVFRPQRPCCCLDMFAAHAQPRPSCLKRGNLLKLRSCSLQPLIKRIGKHSPSILQAAFDTAIVAFADAIQAGRIGNR